jgi:hypothetical protein
MSRYAMKPLEDFSKNMAQTASDMKDRVSDTLDQQRKNAADNLGRAASALRWKAKRVPGGPIVVSLTRSVADGMQSTATYVRRHDFSRMGQDFINVCRRNPAKTLTAALAIGYFIGRSRR